MKDLVISIVAFQHTQQQLEPTLSSILELESELDWMLVIVDNGGCEWLKKWSSHYENILYIKAESNRGYGYGHNLAIKEYAPYSKFYLVCNPDITFSKDQFIKLFQHANQVNTGLTMPLVLYPNGERQELCKILPSPLNLFARRFWPQLAEKLDDLYLLRNADYSKSFFAPSLSGCFMLFRSDSLIAVGGFDERFFMYMEDIDLSRRVATKFGAEYYAHAYITHVFEKASYKNFNLLKEHIISAIRYFNKWGWFFDQNRIDLNKKCIENLPKK